MAYLGLVLVCAVSAIILAVGGRWRRAFGLFAIPPARMTVQRLGLGINDSADAARVNSILQSFITAFNRAIARPGDKAWAEYCDSLPPFLQPFGHEGGAMGYTLRRLFRYDPEDFERTLVRPRPQFRYLYYVGLGFWSGIRRHSPARLFRIVRGLDPLHGYLVFDGYGFARTFFESPKNPCVFEYFDALPGYARNAAYQGVGRALYFLHLGDNRRMVDQLERLGPHGSDAAAGMGLAAVFVHPDRLDRAQGLAEQMPETCRDHFHLGMCFGLKARSINDLDEFEKNLARLPGPVQHAIWCSIRECDRAELLVRAKGGEEGYRLWRGRVTQWMGENLHFPLRGVRECRPVEPAYIPEDRLEAGGPAPCGTAASAVTKTISKPGEVPGRDHEGAIAMRGNDRLFRRGQEGGQ